MSRKESRTFRYWLLVGLVLHGVAGLVLQPSRGGLLDSVEKRPPMASDVELYLEEGPATGAGATDTRSAATSATNPSATNASARSASTGTDERASSETRAAAPAASAAPAAPRVASVTRQADPRDGARVASAGLPPSTPGTPAEPAASGEAAPADAVAPRPLSLDELGVGTFNPFLGDELAKPGAPAGRGTAGAAAASGRKLEQSIETALARRDQRIGLGPEGPVVSAVETLVMQSSTAPNGDATLFVRTDAAGKVVHTEVRAASSDGPEWERIARELMRVLGGKTMRVPPGSQGVSFQLKVTSREQLPSGAAPGLEINVLGATLKRGRGDNSTKISVLEPKIETRKVPLPNDPLEREVESVVVSLVPFALFGDPVDIGAPARRVVRAHLRDLTVH